jgi:hypothetical protein
MSNIPKPQTLIIMNFREYCNKDKIGVINLLNKTFVDNHVTIESFEWKYFDRFFEGLTAGFVCETENKIIGFVCFVPAHVEGLDNSWICSVMATDPEFLRQGIAKNLTKLCESKIGEDASYIGFSNASGVKVDRNSKTIAYQEIGQFVSTYITPLQRTNASFEVISNTDFDFDIKPHHFTLHSSKEFIKWRYFSNPKIKFEYIDIYSDDKLVAKCIFRPSKFFVNIYWIGFEDNSDNTKSNILKHLSTHFAKQFKILKVTYLPNHFWQSIIPHFWNTKSINTYLTVKSSNQALTIPSNWNLQKGDIL